MECQYNSQTFWDLVLASFCNLPRGLWRFKSAGIQFLSRRHLGKFGLLGKLDQGKGALGGFLEVPVVVSREPSLMKVGEPRNPVSAG
jgi:hypothetical protein